MTTDPRDSIARLRERLQESEAVSERDRQALERFDDALSLKGNTYSDHRHRKHLIQLLKMAEEAEASLAAALEDRDAAEDLVRWIHENYENPESNRDRRISLRMFGELATDGDEKPESIAWIPATYPSNYDPGPDPTEMLRWDEDVEPLLEAAQNLRDRALVALAWDAGPRGGELHSIDVGDLQDHEYGLQLTLSGKQGRRSVTLIPSVPMVNQWLSLHPASDSDDAPLWSALDDGQDRVSYAYMSKALKELADRAGVDRPVTPTNFRKSSASYLASQGVPQAHLEDHHGWARGSDQAARYIAVFGEAADREIAAAHGLDVEPDEPEPLAPLECPRCGQETPRDDERCVWCGQALEQSAANRTETAVSEVLEAVADEEGAAADGLVELGQLLQDHPELADVLGSVDRD